jgi:hypothetical protein
MTACERVNAMVPRWRLALAACRRLGTQVIWAPSDVVGSYAGWPQRERALAMPLSPVPKVRDLSHCEFERPRHHCMCDVRMRCEWNYGFDAIVQGLSVEADDLIISTTEEAYAALLAGGRKTILYMGLHTNMCLFGKPGALKWMHEAGLDCYLCRDINDAFTCYDPAAGFTPDDGTRLTDQTLERAGIATINIVDELRQAGAWDEQAIYETVRITPWGKPERPNVFEKDVPVTLTTPWLEDVTIRYTTTGRHPTADDPAYHAPLTLTETTTLAAAAFRDGKQVSLVSDAYFVRLPPEPAKPDVYLDDLDFRVDPYATSSADPAYAFCLWKPQIGRTFEGKPIRMRAVTYERGLGCRAPTAVHYSIRPEWKRFVALAGVDDNLLDDELGRNLAAYAAVVSKVFIDGQLMAESPVVRTSQEPWRFDVPIPAASRMINLVCTNARSRNVLDYGCWANAGFVLG